MHEPEKRRQGPDGSGSAAAALAGRRPPSIAPPHFYRELTRTTEGCRLLRDKGHFGDFVETIREYGLEKDDAETIVKVKGCLWAVGNVGSMELGAPFIEEWNVVDVILRVAESSEVLSMRGTAFFVLGLISRSLHGSEMLTERGWDGASTTMGESLGRFIPLHLGRIFSVGSFHRSSIFGGRLSLFPRRFLVYPRLPAPPIIGSLRRYDGELTRKMAPPPQNSYDRGRTTPTRLALRTRASRSKTWPSAKTVRTPASSSSSSISAAPC